jgi:hypothetical protein
MESTLEAFIGSWPIGSEDCRGAFVELRDYLQGLANVELEFHARPGVTYSLRGVNVSDAGKPLFVMVDVIDDQPRWLSVCFYDHMVADPDEIGNYVPGGLLGEDGRCFDLEQVTGRQLLYLKERISEAHAAGAV